MKGHPGAVYKGFSTHSEACNFVQGQGGYGGPSRGRGGGGGQSSGRTQLSYQPAQSSSYKSSGSKPSYSSSARQRYCGNFTSNRRFVIIMLLHVYHVMFNIIVVNVLMTHSPSH